MFASLRSLKFVAFGGLLIVTCAAAFAEDPDPLAATIKERGEVLQQIVDSLEKQTPADASAFADLQKAKIALLCFQRDTATTPADKQALQTKVVDIFESIFKNKQEGFGLGVITNLEVLRSRADLLSARQVLYEMKLSNRDGARGPPLPLPNTLGEKVTSIVEPAVLQRRRPADKAGSMALEPLVAHGGILPLPELHDLEKDQAPAGLGHLRAAVGIAEKDRQFPAAIAGKDATAVARHSFPFRHGCIGLRGASHRIVVGLIAGKGIGHKQIIHESSQLRNPRGSRNRQSPPHARLAYPLHGNESPMEKARAEKERSYQAHSEEQSQGEGLRETRWP